MTAEQLDLALPAVPPPCARCGTVEAPPAAGERVCWHCYAALCSACHASPEHCGDEHAELAVEYLALEAVGRAPRRTRVQLLWMSVDELRSAVARGHASKPPRERATR